MPVAQISLKIVLLISFSNARKKTYQEKLFHTFRLGGHRCDERNNVRIQPPKGKSACTSPEDKF